ncbi:hypothetical protein [Ornithinimicrobium sp. W1665]|uniref:hypothetical protein n=1 Tax=Ornithinimicrobium sp. W1665 TaxID=3416666 RepID=UPI003CF4B66D
MYFSEAFAIDAESPEWVDIVLNDDTALFVDPFLIFQDESDEWKDAHSELMAHFQKSYDFLAGHQDNENSLQYKRVVEWMKFPEPREFCLGVSSESVDGAGGGLGLARTIVEGMAIAINAGIEDLTHFEELGVLVPRIGRDRISDLTCNILKNRFIEYTQSVCRDFEIPMKAVPVARSQWDSSRNRYVDAVHELPENPFYEGRGILLTPKRFVRQLPVLGSDDWYEYIDTELRDDLNLAISENLNKARIVEIARSNPQLVRSWVESREDREQGAYDVDRDPAGLLNWLAQGREVADQFAFHMAVQSTSDLMEFVEEVNRKFARFVEAQGGWSLLWNDDSRKPKHESAIQLLYRGVVQAYCEANDVIVDREVELGRGPVDFAFSRGASIRVLMEIKKLNSDAIWHGLEEQLVSYMESDGCTSGWYLAVQFYDSPTQKERLADFPGRVDEAAQATGFDLHGRVVTAIRPKPASKAKRVKKATP